MYLDLRLGKRNFGLGISVIFLVSFTLSLMQRSARDKMTKENHGRLSEFLAGSFGRDQAVPPALARCWKLNGLLGTRNLSIKSVLLHLTDRDEELVRAIQASPVPEKDRKILEHLLMTEECPWQPSATAVAQYRIELGGCCNASFWLALTKENTPLGSVIVLDGSKGQMLPVKEELVDLLPERLPIAGELYERCAVVGNGGILRNSSCGQEIDQADLVLRFNMPPMNYSEDVGTKTSLVTINPSILQLKFNSLRTHRKPFADALRPYGGALFFIPAFSYVGHSEVGYQAAYTMEDFGMGRQAYFMNPRYLGSLELYWKGQGLNPRRLSSGFMLVSMALEFCERITLYGFWPFSHNLARQQIPHHYYDNRLPQPGVHAMDHEFSHYLKMYAQGVLRLRLSKCQ